MSNEKVKVPEGQQGKHTPTPWRVDPDFPEDILGADGIDVATVCCPGAKTRRERHQRLADCDFIVRAVNAHDSLVAALRNFVEHVECFCADNVPAGNGVCPLHQAEAALSLVGGSTSQAGEGR